MADEVRKIADRDGQAFEVTLARSIMLIERKLGRDLDQAEYELCFAAVMRLHGASETSLPPHLRQH